MMVCKGTGRIQLGGWTPCPGWFSLFGFVSGAMQREACGVWGRKRWVCGVSLCSCQNQRGSVWVDVWLNFGCFMCAKSTLSSGEVELQIVVFLEGGWALCAQTGNCGSSPWSSCWQFPACLYYHLCPSVHVDSLSSLPTLQTLIMKGWVFLSLTYMHCPY